MLLAHMVSVNGVGLELFQLLDPPHERREPSLEDWKSGTSEGRAEAPQASCASATL
jgi:hypothetical protein